MCYGILITKASVRDLLKDLRHELGCDVAPANDMVKADPVLTVDDGEEAEAFCEVIKDMRKFQPESDARELLDTFRDAQASTQVLRDARAAADACVDVAVTDTDFVVGDPVHGGSVHYHGSEVTSLCGPSPSGAADTGG